MVMSNLILIKLNTNFDLQTCIIYAAWLKNLSQIVDATLQLWLYFLRLCCWLYPGGVEKLAKKWLCLTAIHYTTYTSPITLKLMSWWIDKVDNTFSSAYVFSSAYDIKFERKR